MGSFCSNHIKFQLKSIEQLSLMTLKSDEKFTEKLPCRFKYDEEFGKFHPTTQKSENFTSMSSFCQKYIRFELRKYGGVIFYDNEQ